MGETPTCLNAIDQTGRARLLVYNTMVNLLNIPASTSLWAVYVGMNWLLAAFIAIRYGASRLKCAKS